MTQPEKSRVQTVRTDATWVLLLVGILMGAIFFVMGIILLQSVSSEAEATPEPTTSGAFSGIDAENAAYAGVEVIDPPRPMPDFTLTNQQGEATSLSDLQGQPTLITFGFTNCPDICPLTLNEWRGIRADLGDTGAAVNYVFVSVDGQRDTPEALQRYFAVRDVPDFVGLTGPETEVRRIMVDYGATFETGPADANGRYNVDHTAASFLLDADGRWIRTYVFGTEPDVIVQDLQQMMNAA